MSTNVRPCQKSRGNECPWERMSGIRKIYHFDIEVRKVRVIFVLMILIMQTFDNEKRKQFFIDLYRYPLIHIRVNYFHVHPKGKTEASFNNMCFSNNCFLNTVKPRLSGLQLSGNTAIRTVCVGNEKTQR